MAARSEQARELVVARPAGFIYGCKGLVDDEDVHDEKQSSVTAFRLCEL
jgi:hypothetical protein